MMALCVAFAAGAQTGLVEFPYNPDADNDDIIGVNDLLELLSLFGGEFADESLYMNDSNTAAVYHIEGAWNYGMCEAKCHELPSGKWRMLDFKTWAEFHNEVEAMTTVGIFEAWLADEPLSFGYSSNNLAGMVIGGDNSYKGRLDARSLGDDKSCVCETHERPKVEYSYCEGSDIQGCADSKIEDGWYPLGGISSAADNCVCGTQEKQAFWRWAE